MNEDAFGTQIAAVLRMFGLGEMRSVPREVARGEMGRVIRVETSGGTWALKEYLTPTWAPRDAQLEERFMDAAQRAGVAAPRACRTSDGRTLAAVEGVRWKAFEWIEVAGIPSVWQLGETVARLHGIGWPSDQPVHPWYTQRSAGGTWQELADLSRGQDWEALLGHHVAELSVQDQIVAGAEMPPCRMCHRDINEGNVVVDLQGRVVLFDWDDCGPLAPEREVACVLVNPFVCPDPGAFLAAYRNAGGTYEPTGLDVFATAIAMNNNYLAALVYRSVGGDRRAHEELLSMLESPLTISDMQALLAVARV